MHKQHFALIEAVPHIKGYLIKTHGSESRGQERAKRSPKTKRATNYSVLCIFYAPINFAPLATMAVVKDRWGLVGESTANLPPGSGVF